MVYTAPALTSTSTSFRINRPHVVDETIDGETILIHLATGVYYSLDGVASDIWSLVREGVGGERIVAMLTTEFPDHGPAVRRDVHALIAELVDEDLISAGDAPAPGAPGQVAGVAGDYVAPVLHKYTDMQAFMLADPLHDVDEEAGWPNVKAG